MPATVIRGAQNTGSTALAGGTSLNGHVIRLFADFQDYLDPKEVSFTSGIKRGNAVNQKKVEWLLGYLAPHQVTLGAGGIADGTTTSIVFAAGETAKVMVTDLIEIENEVVWVRALNDATNTATVTRAMGGTTGSAHPAGLTCDIFGPAAQENADSPIAPIAKGSTEHNLFQIWDYAVQVSEVENVTPDYEFNTGDKYDAYLKKRMVEAGIHFEKTAIRGRRGSESSMLVGAGTPSAMGGLDFFTTREYALGGAPIVERNLTSVMQDLWTTVGPENMPKEAYCGPFVRTALSSLFNSNRQATVKDEKTSLVWTEVQTDFGPIRFQLSRYMNAGSLYFVNRDKISIHPYKGMAWRDVKLPSNGPYIRGRFTGAYTMVFRDTPTRAKVTGISTDPAQYPNM